MFQKQKPKPAQDCIKSDNSAASQGEKHEAKHKCTSGSQKTWMVLSARRPKRAIHQNQYQANELYKLYHAQSANLWRPTQKRPSYAPLNSPVLLLPASYASLPRSSRSRRCMHPGWDFFHIAMLGFACCDMCLQHEFSPSKITISILTFVWVACVLPRVYQWLFCIGPLLLEEQKHQNCHLQLGVFFISVPTRFLDGNCIPNACCNFFCKRKSVETPNKTNITQYLCPKSAYSNHKPDKWIEAPDQGHKFD